MPYTIEGPQASKYMIEPPAAAAPVVAAAPKPAPVVKPGVMPPDTSGPAKDIIPPVVNFLDYPIRDLAARLVGATPGVGALPTDPASRQKFYEARDKALAATALPETKTGEAISKALSFPGSMVGSGVEDASKRVLGTGVTQAISPYVGAAGDVVPFLTGKIAAERAANPAAGMVPRAAAQSARAAGYKLPPEEIMDTPSLLSRVLAGDAGKYKRQQAFSQQNQNNTNALAAKAIGLPQGTVLNEAAFDRARKPAEQAYGDVTRAIPDTALGADPEFRKAVSNVGVKSEILEKFFPEAAHNPQIATLRERLLRNASAPTEAVRRQIADLRFEASRNFKKPDDAQAHALGLAQRQAATALEDAIERSIGYGKDRVDAFVAHRKAADALAKAKYERVRPAEYQSEQQAFDSTRNALMNKLATITPAEQALARQTMQRFREARSLFSRIYDVESVTNKATGDVIARRVASLRSGMKRPLTGELKQIADTYDAFPKQMQSPSAFGHTEDFSILDLYGGGLAALSGHPGAAVAVIGRVPSRRILASDRYQKRMFGRPRVFTDPIRGAIYGDVLVPHEDAVNRALLGY